MQSLNDDERSAILGEVLTDELRVIREYVQDVPLLTHELKRVVRLVEGISENVTVISAVVKDHEIALQALNQKVT